MEEKTAYNYLKFKRIIFEIVSVIDILILILLAYLGYVTAFWIFLVICILECFGFIKELKRREQQLDLYIE